MAGETSEFARRVLPHLDAAYNLARWLMRDPSVAEDVVQEAMLRALRFQGGLRGDAKPWLLQIVRNAAFATMAATRKHEPLPEESEEPADPAPDPEAALSRRQDQRQLDRALAALPAELRECLVLRELEEMSYKEIAQITDTPIGTVMSRLWRARQLLLGAAR
jgi:RNA polymerase sigma-70 factor (ECF subfamily)